MMALDEKIRKVISAHPDENMNVQQRQTVDRETDGQRDNN